MVEDIPPLAATAARYLIAGALFALLWALTPTHRSHAGDRTPTTGESILLGIVMLGGGAGLAALGVQYIDAGKAALLFAIVPVWIALIGLAQVGNSRRR